MSGRLIGPRSKPGTSLTALRDDSPDDTTGNRFIVVTPGIGGSDGIAAVSRLVVGALGVREVSVVSLADRPGASNGRFAEHCVRAANGRKLRFVTSVVAATAPLARAPRVVCLHLALSPVAWLASRGGDRLTVFLNGIEAWRHLGPVQRWVLGRAETLVAISEHTAQRFRAANPALADKPITVCHLGATPVHDTNEQPSRAAEPPFALIVGRMASSERYKGHDLLLDLWPSVVAMAPGARLVVAGDGDDRPRLEAKARARGGHATFLGHVTDAGLLALYRDCAFFVMPSRDEGFGLVFLEAMRAGKACIGGVGAATEVIRDGMTGLVVDPGEPAQVLEALVRFFRDHETRVRMGQAGAERFARHFTEAHFHRRFRAALGLSVDTA